MILVRKREEIGIKDQFEGEKNGEKCGWNG